MDDFELASALTGATRAEKVATNPTHITMISGVATSDSADGKVTVNLGGDAVTSDGLQQIEVSTSVSVKQGDMVRVTLVGTDGTAKDPLVTDIVGGGDRMQKLVDTLTGYVYVDDSGVVVGKDGGTARAHMDTDGSFKVEDADGNMLTKMSAEFQLTPADEYFQKSLLNGGDSIIMRTKAEVSPGSFQHYPSVEASMHDEYTAGYTSLKDSMVKIAAANLKVWDIYNTAASYVTMRHFCDLLSPVVLYNSTAGTNGTVTLAGNAADYERLKIYYKSDDNTYSSVEVYQPDGKRVELSVNHCTGTSASAAGPIWVKGCMVTISGTSITVGTYGNAKIDTTASSSVSVATENVIKIVRVEGVRA